MSMRTSGLLKKLLWTLLSGKKVQDDTSSGMEILMTTVFLKIIPTDPSILVEQVT